MPKPNETQPTAVRRKAPPVRSLTRGLEVLTLIENSRGLTLAELHGALRLPKSTLTRIVQTLVTSGYVWRRIADGAYCASMTRPYLPWGGPDDYLAEVASAHLARLTEEVRWPSVIATPRTDHMVVVETNSPLAHDEVRLGPVGARLSYVHTATGRAFLSACNIFQQNEIIGRLRPAGLAPGSEALLRDQLSLAAKRGFATREPLLEWPGFMYAEVRRDAKCSFAVPILASGVAVAALNVHWPVGRDTIERVVTDHLHAVVDAARRIGAALGAASARLSGRGARP